MSSTQTLATRQQTELVFRPSRQLIRRPHGVASALVAELRARDVPAAPFCRNPRAEAEKPFYAHSGGGLGWLCVPYAGVAEHVPPPGRQILAMVARSGFPVSDPRVALQVRTIAPEALTIEESFDHVLVAMVRATQETLALMARGASKAAQGVASVGEFLFERLDDPLLLVRVEPGGHFVQVYRWDQVDVVSSRSV